MVKVSIVKCPSYDKKTTEEAVFKALSLLGPLGQFLDLSSRFLIKPNLLSARPPESGVDTHPEVVRAVIEFIKKDFKADIFIGDSPGGFISSVDEVYKISGMEGVAKSTGTKTIKFDKIKWINNFPIAQAALDFNLVSIPKLKTHDITTITVAIKNIFGTVAGMYKLECHKRATSPEKFGSLLADLYSVVKPRLSVVDAVCVMEADGPTNGILRNLGLILASSDAVALDAVIAHIIGLNPMDIPMIRFCHERNLGCARLKDIEIVGEKLESVKVNDFKLPSVNKLIFIVDKIPKPIRDQIAKYIYFQPYINTSKCSRCGLCIKSCPMNCMKMDKGQVVIDYKRCIKCFCCREFCVSDAIDIRESFAIRVLKNIRGK